MWNEKLMKNINLINVSKMPVHLKFKEKQYFGGRKNWRRQRVLQIACVRKKARIISIDARVANFDTKFMRRNKHRTSFFSSIFKTRHTITKLLPAPTKKILVINEERGKIAAQLSTKAKMVTMRWDDMQLKRRNAFDLNVEGYL